MSSQAPLHEAVIKTRQALERDLSEAEAFACLFDWLAGKIRSTAGLDAPPLLGSDLPAEVSLLLEQPGLAPFWKEEETLGWAYQFWLEKEKADIFRRLYRQKQKIRAGDIPAATALFTPGWIARFLVDNTLGRLWLQMHPDTRLRSRLAALLPVFCDLPPEPARPASEIRLLDPACGAMNIGLAAFDLLAALYQEELERAGQPGWPVNPSVQVEVEIPAAILARNLYGWDIDPRALELARLALLLRAGRLAPGQTLPAPHLQLIDDPAGSLRQVAGEPRFDCLLANPPYMVGRNMEGELSAFLRVAYPEARGDLYAAFILRCLRLLRPGGRAGLITQQSFMFLPSYRRLRAHLACQSSLEVLLHTGPGAFQGIAGEKVNTAAFVLRREGDPDRRAKAQPSCLRLLAPRGVEAKEQSFWQALAGLRAGEQVPAFFAPPAGSFALLPGQPWVYWAPSAILEAFRRFPPLGDLPGTDGNKTGANQRYIRPVSELPADALASGTWRLLARPAFPEPFRQSFQQAVDWSPEAREFYRRNPASNGLPESLAERGGVSWSRVSSHHISARRFPPGVIPDVATPAVYPPNEESAYLATLLNSQAGRYLLKLINPTINYALGDIRRLPLPPAGDGQKHSLQKSVERIEAAWREVEAGRPEPEARTEIAALEAEMDAIVYTLYGFSEEVIAVIQQGSSE